MNETEVLRLTLQTMIAVREQKLTNDPGDQYTQGELDALRAILSLLKEPTNE